MHDGRWRRVAGCCLSCRSRRPRSLGVLRAGPADVATGFSPLALTLRAFVTQVMSQDHSCRETVARVNAWRLSHGLRATSGGTSSYCKARSRIPVELMRSLVRVSASEAEELGEGSWRWKGRSVKLIDGTTLSMPDTEANQKAFPQHPNAKPGLGFPLARAVAVMSLATGCVLDIATAAWNGKLTGEHALLRRLLHAFVAGDIAVADRYYDSFFLAARFRAMDVDTVFRVHTKRHVDFRAGRRLGHNDHVVVWHRPPRPDWLTTDEYAAFPETMLMREVRARLSVPGFRVRDIVLTTTMLSEQQATANELAGLYRQRWHAELDLRSIKTTMQMDVLRGLSPDMVEKEIAAHLIAYNLLRRVMMDATSGTAIDPRSLSFKAALQTVNAYLPILGLMHSTDIVGRVHEAILNALRRHRVGNRPGRSEPRARKRRSSDMPLLTTPRWKYSGRRTSSTDAP